MTEKEQKKTWEEGKREREGKKILTKWIGIFLVRTKNVPFNWKDVTWNENDRKLKKEFDKERERGREKMRGREKSFKEKSSRQKLT